MYVLFHDQGQRKYSQPHCVWPQSQRAQSCGLAMRPSARTPAIDVRRTRWEIGDQSHTPDITVMNILSAPPTTLTLGHLLSRYAWNTVSLPICNALHLPAPRAPPGATASHSHQEKLHALWLMSLSLCAHGTYLCSHKAWSTCVGSGPPAS